jgi:menin
VDAGLPLLQDPEVYALLLQFYDGICQWEEGSQTPVLHITWAKHFCFTLNKFECCARENLHVEADSESSDSDEELDTPCAKKRRRSNSSEKKQRRREHAVLLNNNYEQQLRTTIEELASRVGPDTDLPDDPNIAALAHACGESILNPEFLLSGGEPFRTPTSERLRPSTVPSEPAADLLLFRSRYTRRPDGRMAALGTELGDGDCDGPQLQLHSMKMKGMRRLLVAEKLNNNAIKLQLTAQSQVHLKQSKVASHYDFTLPSRRSRTSTQH